MKKTTSTRKPAATKPTLSAVLATVGATRDDFNNWLRRGHFRGTIAATNQGVPRQVSRLLALQIGFMKALTIAGLDASDAAKVVFRLASEAHYRTQPWFIFDPAQFVETLIEVHYPDWSIASMPQVLSRRVHDDGSIDPAPQPVRQFAVVHIGGIIQAVNNLFGER